MRKTPSDDHQHMPDGTGLPDLTLFALSEEIVSTWSHDPASGREMLLATMRAHPDLADALLGWVADDLHDDTLDALLGAEQARRHIQPHIGRVAEQRAPYGETEKLTTDGN